MFVNGKYTIYRNKIYISELPDNINLEKYDKLLDTYIDKNIIKRYFNYSSESIVFYIIEPQTYFDLSDDKEIKKLFKLESKQSINNLICFNEDQTAIMKFED